jgi:hypothetical protein
MFDRISNGWELAKQSFRVLMLDKEMLLFPLLSGIACLLVLASFAVPLAGSDYVQDAREDGTAPTDPMAYVILFAFYFCNYFVIVFFNAALIACAIIRFNGGDPTVADGLRAAVARLPQIIAWSLVSATVGVILKAIESRSERAGRIAVGLLGAAWGIATYFVVPVLVVEKVGPFEALKRSLSVLRKTWGEAIVANFGIGVIIFVVILACFIPAVIGFVLGGQTMVISGIVVSVLLVILVSLVSSAVNTIVVGALYQYAASETTPQHFDAQALSDAFAPKH